MTVTIVDREGIFKTAPITSVHLDCTDSGAIAAVFCFPLVEMWNPDESCWVEWDYGQHVYAHVWLVQKNGEINQRSVNTLKNVLAWDGDLKSFDSGWPIPACQVVVRAEEYKGNIQFRVAWINPISSSPDRAERKTDPATLTKLMGTYGAKLRAAYGARPLAPKPAPQSTSAAPPQETSFDEAPF